MARDLVVPTRATVQDSYLLAKACQEAESDDGPLTLDCSATTMFGPFGVALLASSIATRRLAGRQTALRLPRDPIAAQFLDEIGLESFAKGRTTGIGTLEIRQLTALDATYTQAVTDMVMRGVPGMDDQAGYLIQLCLNELLQNVFEWSESPIGCTVLARWYHKTRSVRLAVVDRGIGIPAALRRHKVRGLHRSSDAEVIKAAVMTPQLTSRENRVGGLGLKTIREEVTRRRGRLTVVALSAKVVWSGERATSYQAFPLRGTAVEIDFRPEQSVTDAHEFIAVF